MNCDDDYVNKPEKYKCLGNTIDGNIFNKHNDQEKKTLVKRIFLKISCILFSTKFKVWKCINKIWRFTVVNCVNIVYVLKGFRSTKYSICQRLYYILTDYNWRYLRFSGHFLYLIYFWEIGNLRPSTWSFLWMNGYIFNC
jgi:hypothetical protein